MRRRDPRLGSEVTEESGFLSILTTHDEPPGVDTKYIYLITPRNRRKEEFFRSLLGRIR